MSTEIEHFAYRVTGLRPESEVPEGNLFYSNIPNLDEHPELWEEECPYNFGKYSTPLIVREPVSDRL